MAPLLMNIENLTSSIYQDIQSGIVALLESARASAARSVNTIMTASYWEIGRRIVAFEQGGESRAGYGEVLIPRLAEDLTRRFGRGFSERNIEQMRKFYLSWPIPQTVSAESVDPGISQTASREIVNPVPFAMVPLRPPDDRCQP